MLPILRKLLFCGALAAALSGGSPAAATYWWSWAQKPPKPAQAEATCQALADEVRQRAEQLRTRLGDRAAQARYAYTFNSYAWFAEARYRTCMRLMAHWVPVQSGK